MAAVLNPHLETQPCSRGIAGGAVTVAGSGLAPGPALSWARPPSMGCFPSRNPLAVYGLSKGPEVDYFAISLRSWSGPADEDSVSRRPHNSTDRAGLAGQSRKGQVMKANSEDQCVATRLAVARMGRHLLDGAGPDRVSQDADGLWWAHMPAGRWQIDNCDVCNRPVGLAAPCWVSRNGHIRCDEHVSMTRVCAWCAHRIEPNGSCGKSVTIRQVSTHGICGDCLSAYFGHDKQGRLVDVQKQRL